MDILYGKKVAIDSQQNLGKYFELIAKKYYHEVALEYKRKEYSFGEINILVNKYANYLHNQCVRNGSYIFIIMNSTPELLIAILACNKIGAVCVLIGSEMPERRLEALLEKLEVELVISNTGNVNLKIKICVCNLDKHFPYEESQVFEVQNLSVETDAFVFFTSGSSGEPKGVLISHGAILNDALQETAEPLLSANDSLLMMSPSESLRITGEIYYPWFAGAKVIMLEEKDDRDIKKISQMIRDRNISVLFCVPNFLKNMISLGLLKMCVSLKYIQSLGDRLTKSLIVDVGKNSDAILIDMYGQTEAGCCYITYYKYGMKKDEHVIANRAIGINQDRIYIGGAYLSKGYINNGILHTREMISSKGELLYKTEDIGRIINGRLEYLGRESQIVKISGKKISLQEVETAILLLNNVTDVAVIPVWEGERVVSLYAILETEDMNLDSEYWRTKLMQMLPAYMLPNKYLCLDKFPITSAGKVDRIYLEQLIQEEDVRKDCNKHYLADMWRRILDCEKDFSDHDNFIEVGGDSILAAMLIVEISDYYKIELSFEQIYSLTLKELIGVVEIK